MEKIKVAIIMGSDSDLPVVEKTIHTLKDLGIPFEAHVMSAHRTPEEACAFARTAAERASASSSPPPARPPIWPVCWPGIHPCPVIGIPMKSSTMDGLDSLLSTVQMPSGVPVATVAIDGAENAGLLAAQMLAIADESLFRKLQEKKEQMRQKVMEKDKKLQEKLQG